MFVAASASAFVFQKDPFSPLACAALLESNISLNIALILAMPDNSVIALNIPYLGSDISPIKSLITFGGAPVLSIISFINFSPGKSVIVFLT